MATNSCVEGLNGNRRIIPAPGLAPLMGRGEYLIDPCLSQIKPRVERPCWTKFPVFSSEIWYFFDDDESAKTAYKN